MRVALRRLAWSIPIAVTFTDVVASVIRVDGASMQPTLNPRSSSSSSSGGGGGGDQTPSSSGGGGGAGGSQGSSGGGTSSSGNTTTSSSSSSSSSSTQRDWVLVDKWCAKVAHSYRRGDVVVLWAPDAPHQQIVKRLIALEGDTVAAADGGVKGAAPTVVPEGRCWVEGDNEAESLDSRSAYGPVHLGLLEGRVTHIIWPPSRAHRLAPYVPPGRVAKHAADAL